MAAGLGEHAARGELLGEVGEEVRRDDGDLAGLAHVLELADGAHQRVAAATGDDEGVHVGVGVDELLGDLGALSGGGVRVDGVGHLGLVVGVSVVPLLQAGLVALPAELERGVADRPALEADVTGAGLVGAALLEEETHERLAVEDLVLVDGAHVVLGLLGDVVDVGGSGLGDDAVELRDEHLVLVAGVDDGGHLGIRGVADDDAVAAGGSEGLGGSSDLLGDVALVDDGGVSAEDLGGLLADVDGQRAKGVGRAPDGDADLHLVARAGRPPSRSAATVVARGEECGSTQASAGDARKLEEIAPRKIAHSKNSLQTPNETCTDGRPTRRPEGDAPRDAHLSYSFLLLNAVVRTVVTVNG